MNFIKTHKVEVFVASMIIAVFGFALGCAYTGTVYGNRKTAQMKFERSEKGMAPDENGPDGTRPGGDDRDGFNPYRGGHHRHFNGGGDMPNCPGDPGNGQKPGGIDNPNGNQAPNDSENSTDKKNETAPDQDQKNTDGAAQPKNPGDSTDSTNPDNSTNSTQPKNNSTDPVI